MNYFERELRKIVRHCEYIRNPKYVGRACVGRLDDDIVVKMEFESTMIRDKYNALRVTLGLVQCICNGRGNKLHDRKAL